MTDGSSVGLCGQLLAKCLEDNKRLIVEEETKECPKDGGYDDNGDDDHNGVEDGLVDVIAAQVVSATVLGTDLTEVVVTVVA